MIRNILLVNNWSQALCGFVCELIWLLVSEPGFWGFGRQIPLKNHFYIKKRCWEWSEQVDMVDTGHFGFGILQNQQRFVRK